jgi:hypothetical protein
MSDLRYEALRVAMRKIAWPMMTLREYAEDQGCKLEPVMARQLSNDPNYLKDIAQKAMAEIAAIDLRHIKVMIVPVQPKPRKKPKR